MPDIVHISYFVFRKKYDSECVEHTASNQEQNSLKRNLFEYVFEHENKRPSHENIQNHGHFMPSFQINRIEHYSYNCENCGY